MIEWFWWLIYGREYRRYRAETAGELGPALPFSLWRYLYKTRRVLR